MARFSVLMLAGAAVLLMVPTADAQGRQGSYGRNDVARAQGVPPGHLPPRDMCRVWYANRANGRQPSPTTCRQAEAIAARDRTARVIYGEDAYAYRYGYGARDTSRYPETRYPDTWERDRRDNDRAVRRPGRNRDPRASGGIYGSQGATHSRYTTPAFQSGYRDGLQKGREDARGRGRYDPQRHSWYRSANRGYQNEYGTRSDYQVRYRDGFEIGYEEGFRAASFRR
jgi:hypothetical protein